MRRPHPLLLLLALALLGCGSSTPSGSADAGGSTDLARPAASCMTRTDCRLFSSYCATAPCQCLALGARDVDPPCTGGQMSCLVDPCNGKSADCVAGACVVTP